MLLNFSLFRFHCRLNSSLVSLVAISANPAAEGTTSMLSNGAQRTVAPTIVKPIHNGTTMSLVNVTPAEPSNMSEYIVCVCFSPPFYLYSPNSPCKHTQNRTHVVLVHTHVRIHPSILSIQYVLLQILSIHSGFFALSIRIFGVRAYCYCAFKMLCCFYFVRFAALYLLLQTPHSSTSHPTFLFQLNSFDLFRTAFPVVSFHFMFGIFFCPSSS